MSLLYPGNLGVVVRAAMPDLKLTTMRFFFEWMPKELIKTFNKQDKVLERPTIVRLLGVEGAQARFNQVNESVLSALEHLAEDLHSEFDVDVAHAGPVAGVLLGSESVVPGADGVERLADPAASQPPPACRAALAGHAAPPT